MAGVLEQIRAAVHSSQIIVSIAAGILISHISDVLGDLKICRVMPNTPCLVSEGTEGCRLMIVEGGACMIVNY